MNTAAVLSVFSVLLVAGVHGYPSIAAVPAAGVAVVPAGLTVSAAAQNAAANQVLSQIGQAQRAKITNAIAQAQAAQSIGNQANNAAVRNAISQANNERVQNLNNLAQAARNAIAQAQQAQVQVAQSNAAAVRNSAIQAVQGNNAAAVQTISANIGANALGGAPVVIGGGPLAVGIPVVRRAPAILAAPAPALGLVARGPVVLGRGPAIIAGPAPLPLGAIGIPILPRRGAGIGIGIGGRLDLGLNIRG